VSIRLTGIALLVASAVAVLSAPGLAQRQARPSLRLVSDAPVTFRGAGFGAREHVRLVVVGGGRVVKRLVAGTAGGFVVRIVGVDANACRGFSAIATGDRGSRAWFKRAPGQCADPGTSG
jgi:hypothetical protein